MITLDAINLPSDLEWVDEYTWSPVKNKTDITLTGALIIQEAAQLTGREITLQGGTEASWVTRAVVDSLKAKSDIVDNIMTLSYHGRSFSVAFNRAGGNPINSRLIQRIANPQTGDYYSLTLKLMEI